MFRYVSEDSPRVYSQIPATVSTGQVYELPDEWSDPRWEAVTDASGVDVSLPDNVNPPVTQARPAPGPLAKGPIAVAPEASAPEPAPPAPPAPPVPTTETPAAPAPVAQ